MIEHQIDGIVHRRAQFEASAHARREAHLRETLAFVTAMFWAIESGDNLTDAQIAACKHDHVLGILWARIHDYCAYTSLTHRLNHIAPDESTSIYLKEYIARWLAEVDVWRRNLDVSLSAISETVRAEALKSTPRARRAQQQHAQGR